MSQFFVNGCNTYIIGSAIRTDNVEILNRILLIPGLDLQTLINIHKVNASIQRNNIEKKKDDYNKNKNTKENVKNILIQMFDKNKDKVIDRFLELEKYDELSIC